MFSRGTSRASRGQNFSRGRVRSSLSCFLSLLLPSSLFPLSYPCSPWAGPLLVYFHRLSSHHERREQQPCVSSNFLSAVDRPPFSMIRNPFPRTYTRPHLRLRPRSFANNMQQRHRKFWCLYSQHSRSKTKRKVSIAVLAASSRFEASPRFFYIEAAAS